MKKTQVLRALYNTYCRIAPSPIDGVGVFAFRDIPKGTNPFQGIENTKWHKVTLADILSLDPSILRLAKGFFVTRGKFLYVPEEGLNGMNISFFMNDSDAPNVGTDDEGDTFYAARDIHAGEELTISYDTISDI